MNPAKIKDLPVHLNTLVEFIAEWFKHLKDQTYTVKISNPNDLKQTSDLKDIGKKLVDLQKSMGQLSEVVSQIKIPNAPTSISVDNFPEKVGVQKVEVTNLHVDKDVQKVEVQNWKFPEIKFPDIKIPEYPKFPKFPEFKFPKSFDVSNLPKTQRIEGEISVYSFEELLKGIQVVVDSINDLKLEVASSLKVVGSAGVVASTTGSHKEKIPGETRYEPDDSRPIYIGIHQNPDALTSDSDWSVTKYTYDGSTNNATRTVTRRGSWDGRTSLFS